MAPKDLGGLGVGSLQAQNWALLMKWWWKLRDNNHYLWKEVVFAIHGLRDKPLSSLCKANVSGVWNNICKITKDIYELGFKWEDFFSFKIGNGKRIRFWKDHWIGEASFQVLYPYLFSLEKSKNCCIHDRIGDSSFNWNWRHGFDNHVYTEELCSMLHKIIFFSPNDMEDKLSSKLSKDGKFTVGRARRCIEEKITSCGAAGLLWIKWVPLKINCFVWKAQLGKIPVTKCLTDRGLNVGSTICKICNSEVECANHALISCTRAENTLKEVFHWCGILFSNISSVMELLEFGVKWGNCQKKRKVLLAIFQCSLWCIWKARNDLVFNNIRKSHMVILGEIISTSYLWIKHRSRMDCNWLEWGNSPF